MSNSNNESKDRTTPELLEAALLLEILGSDPGSTLRALLPDTPEAAAAISSYEQQLEADKAELNRRTEQS